MDIEIFDTITMNEFEYNSNLQGYQVTGLFSCSFLPWQYAIFSSGKVVMFNLDLQVDYLSWIANISSLACNFEVEQIARVSVPGRGYGPRLEAGAMGRGLKQGQ